MKAKTAWTRRIKEKVSKEVYLEALARVRKPSFVATISLTNENGSWLWVVSDGDFWLDAFPEFDKALALCKGMAWAYRIEPAPEYAGFKAESGSPGKP